MVYIKQVELKKGATQYNIIVDEKTGKTYYVNCSTHCDVYDNTVIIVIDKHICNILDLNINKFNSYHNPHGSPDIRFSDENVVFSKCGLFVGMSSKTSDYICPKVKEKSYIKFFGKYSVVFSGKNKDVYYENQHIIGWKKNINILSVDIVEEGQQKLIRVLEREGNTIKCLNHNHTGNIWRGLDKRILRSYDCENYSIVVCEDITYIVDIRKYTVLTTNLDIPDDFTIKYKHNYGEIPGVGIFSYTNRHLFRPIEGIDMTLDEYLKSKSSITFQVTYVVAAGIYCDGKIKLLLSIKGYDIDVLKLVDIEFDGQPDIYDVNTNNLVYCDKNQDILSYDYSKKTTRKLFNAGGEVKKICLYDDKYLIGYHDDSIRIFNNLGESDIYQKMEIKPNLMVGSVDNRVYIINGKSLHKIENNDVVEINLYSYALPFLGTKPVIYPVHISQGSLILMTNCRVGGVFCHISRIYSSKGSLHEGSLTYYDTELECETKTKHGNIQFFNGYSVEVHRGKRVVYAYGDAYTLIIPNVDLRISSKSSLCL